jgi:peptidoglycan/xylan/chitin deacetylase (PgdA/CDA1 family)
VPAYAYVLIGLAALIGLVYFLAHHTFWLRHRPAHWPRVLMYHRIARDTPSGMNCPPTVFERQLLDLKRKGYRFVTVSELATGHSGKTVALTFDDGYADNFHDMFPLLRKHGAKATIYLATGIQGVDSLSPEQIRTMQASGLIEFGAHTVNHVNLKNTSPEEAQREIMASKADVERLAGVPCLSFAYPFGRYLPEHVDMVRAAGFTTAVTVRKDIARIDATPLEIPRISINGKASALQFAIALRTGRYKL